MEKKQGLIITLYWANGESFLSLHIFCNIDDREYVLAFELKGQQLTVSSDNSLPTQFRGRLKAANRGITINPVLYGYDFNLKFHAELIFKNNFGDSNVRKTPITKLIVEIPPKIERFEKLLSVPENRSAILECIASGNPMPNIVWDMGENRDNIQDIEGRIFKIIYNNGTKARLKPPDRIDLNKDYMNVDDSTFRYIVGSYINVTNLKRHQSRQITCTAITNVFNSASKRSVLHITYPSGPPLELKAVQVTQMSVVLDWAGVSILGHPPIIIEYLIEYRIIPDTVLSPSKINNNLTRNTNEVLNFNTAYGRGPYPGTPFYDSTHPLYWGGPYYNGKFIEPLNNTFKMLKPKPYSYVVASGAPNSFKGPIWSPWDVEPYDGYNWVKIRSPRSIFSVVSLLPGTMYAFRLRAHNGAGYSIPSKEIRVRTSILVMYRGDWAFEFTYPWLIAVVISIILFLIIILSCLAAMVQKKRRKYRAIDYNDSLAQISKLNNSHILTKDSFLQPSIESRTKNIITSSLKSSIAQNIDMRKSFNYLLQNEKSNEHKINNLDPIKIPMNNINYNQQNLNKNGHFENNPLLTYHDSSICKNNIIQNSHYLGEVEITNRNRIHSKSVPDLSVQSKKVESFEKNLSVQNVEDEEEYAVAYV